MSEPKYVNLDTVSIAWLSIWTVLGATPVPIFWIFVLCQFVWRVETHNACWCLKISKNIVPFRWIISKKDCVISIVDVGEMETRSIRWAEASWNGMAGCFLHSTTETLVWYLNADVIDRNQRNGTFCGESIASPVSFPEVPSSALDSSDDGKLEANVNNWQQITAANQFISTFVSESVKTSTQLHVHAKLFFCMSSIP